jgi:hypothetical protein
MMQSPAEGRDINGPTSSTLACAVPQAWNSTSARFRKENEAIMRVLKFRLKDRLGENSAEVGLWPENTCAFVLHSRSDVLVLRHFEDAKRLCRNLTADGELFECFVKVRCNVSTVHAS